MFVFFLFLSVALGNKCADSFTDLTKDTHGLTQLGYMGQHSSKVDLALQQNYMMEGFDVQYHAAPRGNWDACLNIGEDVHACTVGFNTPQAAITTHTVCLPTPCDFTTMGDMSFVTELMPAMGNIWAWHDNCNITEIMVDMQDPEKMMEALADLANCQLLERVVDYMVSVINLPIGKMETAAAGMPLTLTCNTQKEADSNSTPDTRSALIIAMFVLLSAFVIFASAWVFQREEKADKEGFIQLDDQQQRKPMSESVLDCFSVQDNLFELFSPGRKMEFPCLDGLRTFSYMWVILGHVGIFFQPLFSNNADAWFPHGMLSSFTGQVFAQGFLSVDSFFFISGFLATHICLKKLEPKRGETLFESIYQKLPWIYLMRWLRLMIPMFFVMCLLIGIYPMFLTATAKEAGTVWMDGACYDENFVYNLLFISADVAEAGEFRDCLGVTWYLMIDMRGFLFIPVYCLVWHYFSAMASYLLMWAALLGNIIAMFVWSMDKNASPMMMGAPDGDASNVFFGTYMEFWTRYGVMCVGSLLAMSWKLYLNNDKIPKWSRVQVAALFSIMAFCLMGSCYGEYSGYQRDPCPKDVEPSCGSGWNKFSRAIFIALNRPAWGFGLACLCLLCFKDQFFFVNSLLSHDFVKPMARLSFICYLVQMPIFWVWINNETNLMRYTGSMLVYLFFAILSVNFLVGMYLHCIVEKPFQKLLKLVYVSATKSKPTGSAKMIPEAGTSQETKV